MFMPLLPLDFSVAKSIFEYILNIYGVCFECFFLFFLDVHMYVTLLLLLLLLRVCVSYFLFRQLLQFFSFLSIILEIFILGMPFGPLRLLEEEEKSIRYAMRIPDI